MSTVKSISLDRLLKVIILSLVLTTVATRWWPISTVVPEAELSVGFSSQVQVDTSFLPLSNAIRTPNRRPKELFEYRLTSSTGSVNLINNLPYPTSFRVKFLVQDLNGGAGILSFYSRNKKLASMNFQQLQPQDFIIHVGPRATETIFFDLQTDETTSGQSISLKIRSIEKL